MLSYFPGKLKELNYLKEDNLQSIICNRNFKRGAIILSGGYAQQNFYSIMASKLYDIEQNGYCFWAHRYMKNQGLKNALDFFDCEGDKFLFMTYTHNQKYAGKDDLSMEEDESIDHYYNRMWNTVKNDSRYSYVKEYKCYKDDNYSKFPDKMFPEIIFKRNDGEQEIAYVISEFTYMTENIKLNELCGLFKQYTIKDGLIPECNYYKRPNHRLIELKDKANLLLPDKIEKLNEITYIIAKLKYPYSIQIKG